MDRFNIFVLVAFGMIALRPVFAFRGEPVERVRQLEAHSPLKIGTFSVQGKLECNTTSNACSLYLGTNMNGKAYQLTGSNEAFKLFQSGTRNVAVEGELMGSEKIEISRIYGI